MTNVFALYDPHHLLLINSISIFDGSMTSISTDTHNLAGKKVLITGAGGFIGRKLATQLTLAGAEVHGTSRNERNERNGDPLPITWWKGSFEDLESARTILNEVQPNIIFHLSGMATAINTVDHILPTYHSLVTSTVNTLSLAANMGCQRILIIGSTNEPLGMDPNSPYSAAKWASSMYAGLFHRLYDMPIVIPRASVGYGPGQAANKLIPYVISQMINGEKPKLSSGSWKTDWIYIDDMVEGLIRCATEPGIEGLTLDIGTGQVTSVREIVEKIVTLIEPSVTPEFGALPDRYVEHTPVANTEYTLEKIRWKSSVSLDEGLRRTIGSSRRVQVASFK
jgi:nucleoside-diphosphate-sugar epimerase